MLNSSTDIIPKEDLQKRIEDGLGYSRLEIQFDASGHTVSRSLLQHWGTPRLTEIRRMLGVPEPSNSGCGYQRQGFRYA